jgi:hypothetical protein
MDVAELTIVIFIILFIILIACYSISSQCCKSVLRSLHGTWESVDEFNELSGLSRTLIQIGDYDKDKKDYGVYIMMQKTDSILMNEACRMQITYDSSLNNWQHSMHRDKPYYLKAKIIDYDSLSTDIIPEKFKICYNPLTARMDWESIKENKLLLTLKKNAGVVTDIQTC